MIKLSALQKIIEHLNLDSDEYSIVIRSIYDSNIEIEASNILFNNKDKKIIIEYE